MKENTIGQKMEVSIYKMELGEELVYQNKIWYRVPGGWIVHCGSFGIFVKYNTEFQILPF